MKQTKGKTLVWLHISKTRKKISPEKPQDSDSIMQLYTWCSSNEEKIPINNMARTSIEVNAESTWQLLKYGPLLVTAMRRITQRYLIIHEKTVISSPEKLLNTSQHVCMSKENSSPKLEKNIKETNTFTLHLVSKNCREKKGKF
jgi:hypothetical protein